MESVPCPRLTLLISYLIPLVHHLRRLIGAVGEFNGPVWNESGSFEGYMKKLAERKAAGLVPNSTTGASTMYTNGSNPMYSNSSNLRYQQSTGFWLPSLGPLGKASSGFHFPQIAMWIADCLKRTGSL